MFINSLANAEPIMGSDTNLTGYYVGNFKCSWNNNDGSKNKDTTKNSELNIIHEDFDDLIQVNIDGETYCGRVIRTGKDTKGIGVLIKTGSSDDPAGHSKMDYLTWKTNGKAGIKSKNAVFNQVDRIGLCKGNWKRENLIPLAVSFTSCPSVM